MGIRFACHVCSKKLNIKQELAGRRGICPACSSRFRIPVSDTELSTPIDAPKPLPPSAGPALPHSNGIPASSRSDSSGIAAEPENDHGGVATLPEPEKIDALDTDPTSTWYVRPPNGGQYGPADGDTLRQWVDEGRVAANSLLWREGWPQWREAKEALPELVDQLPLSDGAIDAPKLSAVSKAKEALPIQTPAQKASESDIRNFGLDGLEPKIDPTPVSLEPSGRNVGAERRSKSNQRMKMIALLAGTAVVLLFGIIYAISR